jgi:hypothetical protein
VVVMALVVFLILGLLAGLFALRYLQREPVEVSLSPTTAQVETSGVIQFTAEVRGAEDEVIWYVNEVEGGDATNGTISSDGLYRAPSEVPSGPVLVKAVARADETRSAQAQVTVVAAEVAEEETTPEEATTEGTGTEEVTTEEATTEEATTEEATPEETTAEATSPTISLTQIYGPELVEDLCVYRFRAEVTGNPTPTIEFNRDDSEGAWGNDVAQVNLGAGESFTLEATATNSAGSDTASVEIDSECEAVPFAVTSVTANVDPPSFTGACPKRFDFSAVITVNGPGTVTYTWERSDGASAPTESIDFAAAGSQTVTADWTVGTSGSRWRRLRILTPNEMVSNQANFTLTCTHEVTLNVVTNETGVMSELGRRNDMVFAGDGPANDSRSGYISFDITSLAGKTVQSAALTMSPAIESGDRSSFGVLWIGTLDYGTGPLQDSDRSIPAQRLATFPNSVTAISYDGESMKTALQSRIDAGNPRFQLKMYWSRPSSNDNGNEDGLGYLPGNISLRVQYTD